MPTSTTKIPCPGGWGRGSWGRVMAAACSPKRPLAGAGRCCAPHLHRGALTLTLLSIECRVSRVQCASPTHHAGPAPDLKHGPGPIRGGNAFDPAADAERQFPDRSCQPHGPLTQGEGGASISTAYRRSTFSGAGRTSTKARVRYVPMRCRLLAGLAGEVARARAAM